MQLLANAKINIGLNVVCERPDGYHDIETVFYPVRGLYDRLDIQPLKTEDGADSLLLSERGAWRVDCPPEKNLISKVYRLFRANYGIGGVSVACEKNIPFGAGLGGGSADAAFTAVGLNRLFGLGLTSEKLKTLLTPLGADCAFFVENRPCFAEGIGERLTPVPLSLQGYQLLLVKPKEQVSTKEAYERVRVKQPNESLRQLIQTPVSCWRETIVNDFEESVFASHPKIGEIKDQLYEMGAVYASLSGSGATVYGLFEMGKLPAPNALLEVFPDCFVYCENML